MGLYAVPGVESAQTAAAREIIWGATDNRAHIVRGSRIIASTASDAGNTPTTNLRSGLLLGRVASTDELLQWDPLATDGSKDIQAVLETPFELRTTDLYATARDSYYKVLYRAPLMASQLLIKGSAFVGHAYEILARQQLHRAGFILNDDPMGYLTGFVPRAEWATATTLAPTQAQNGTTFYISNAASVTVTLPTPVAGMKYRFVRTADEELVVTLTGKLMVGNDTAANSVTFTTASEHVGAIVDVEAVYIASAGTLVYQVILPPPPFGTGTATMTYGIAT